MLWFSENDLKIFFGDVIRNVAKEMKLSDWEWQFHSELLDQIKNCDPAISQKLDAFFDAYKNWHQFWVGIENAKKTNLSPQETQQRDSLITARDDSRKALLKALRG